MGQSNQPRLSWVGADTRLCKPSEFLRAGTEVCAVLGCAGSSWLGAGAGAGLAGARTVPKSNRQPGKMGTAWLREVKARLMSLLQDSGLAQDLLLSTETVEHCASVPGDAQLWGGHNTEWCMAGAEGSSMSKGKKSSGHNH